MNAVVVPARRPFAFIFLYHTGQDFWNGNLHVRLMKR